MRGSGNKSYLTIYDAVRANFDFIKKLGVDRCCFHDRDIAPDAKNLKASWSDTRITLFFLQWETINKVLHFSYGGLIVARKNSFCCVVSKD